MIGIAWPSLALVASLFMQHHELRKTVGARKEVTEDKLEQVKVAPTNEEDPSSLALTDVK